jgi:hypothetical protein
MTLVDILTGSLIYYISFVGAISVAVLGPTFAPTVKAAILVPSG